MASAIVLSASGGVYDVELEDGTVAEASLRGRLKLEQRTGDRVVAGDIVNVDAQADGSLTIESVEARTSELARRAPGHGRKAKVIVANIDRVMIVFAATEPEPNTRLLDRFLVLAEANRLGALIVLNKVDRVEDGVAESFLAPYETAGYETLRTSVKAGIGIAELSERVCGARSVVTGPSGVGKSSLLNVVQPGLGLRIGAVSESVNKGQHTTVSARLIPLQCGGYVADTPGLRELGLWGIDPEELPDCFPEFADLIGTCRFARSCSHTHEPGCAVREAVESGDIDRGRFDSYLTLRSEAEAAPKY
ncbi:MAG TPA: ribosome small subunit-dependent GTPase A [Longimicrobiales bacterium]|nr:ribosome small subunit-dependent GTPase A [Longimicrobiales bacterium]